jgi:hypothetical protein
VNQAGKCFTFATANQFVNKCRNFGIGTIIAADTYDISSSVNSCLPERRRISSIAQEYHYTLLLALSKQIITGILFNYDNLFAPSMKSL